jgi:hypothetical protein
MFSDHELLERVRAFFAAQATFSITEKRMMGSQTFMVDGNMCCSVGKGRLMVRVGPPSYAKALTEPHVTPLEFAGKAPVGYVCIDSLAIGSVHALNSWLKRGLAFVVTLPSKTKN